jgi:hypothetical protein
MEKTFCIAGPIQQKNHYHLPFRLDEKVLLDLIKAEKYFILHAPLSRRKASLGSSMHLRTRPVFVM